MNTQEARAGLIESHLREAVRMGIGWPRAEYLDRWIQDQVAALSVALDKLSPEAEWEYGTGFAATLGGFWDEEIFPNFEVARSHVAECDEGCVLLRRRPKQDAGPWVLVEGEVR